jgi:ArsR family transcriptional regulator
MATTQEILQILSNQHRVNILHWLADPMKHFEEYADTPERLHALKNDFGVCAGLIHKKSGLAQPTISNYLKQLTKAGLIKTKRYGNWIHYGRNEEAIKEFKKALQAL